MNVKLHQQHNLTYVKLDLLWGDRMINPIPLIGGRGHIGDTGVFEGEWGGDGTRGQS